MGSIYDEITRLETAKTDIETAIEACGVDVPDTKLISDYASYIRQIPSAVFSELNVDPVGGDDKYIKTIELQNGLISATTGGLVSSTSSGLAPKIGTSASSTISALANEWVLTSTKGGSPTWRKLPSNAFKNDNTNTTYSLSGALSGNTYITTLTDSASDTTTATVPAMSGASSTAAGTAGLVPAPAANKHTAFLRGDGTWVVPTNTNYYRPISVNGTSILGNNNTALNLVAGTNISITAENSSGYTGKVTITNTGVRSVTTGTANGTISVDTNGTTANVAVKGLGSAAYTSSDSYVKWNLTEYYNISLRSKIEGGHVRMYYTNIDNDSVFGYGYNGTSELVYITNYKKGYDLRLGDSLTYRSNIIAYTTSDITGNAATADKLKTSRKLWGLDFDGSADVSGNMTGVGVINKVFKVTSTQDIAQLNVSEESTTVNYSHLYVSSNNTSHSNSRPLVLQNGYGNVGIGVIAPTQKLEVNGNVKATSFIGNLDGTYVNALTSYAKATTASDIAATDSLNTALGKLEYKAHYAYNWVTTVTATDTDEYINKWSEIVGFLDSVKEGTDILDEFVTRKTTQTITGHKTFSQYIKVASTSTTSGATLHLTSAINYNSITFGLTKSDSTVVYSYLVHRGDADFRIANNGWTKEYNILHSGNSYIKNGVITINGTSITPLTSHQSLSNYVTLNTEQTITESKTFSKLVTFSATPGILVTRSSGIPYFRFGKDASNVYGAIGASNEGNICVYNDVTGSGWHIVLHSNNYTSYLPILNSSSTHATKSSVIYAPTSGGTSGYILKSNGSSAPTWINPKSLTVGVAQHLLHTGGNTGADKSKGLWFLVGELVIVDKALTNSNVLFYVTDYYQRRTFGILRIEIRWDNNATKPTRVLPQWLVNNGFALDNLQVSYGTEDRVINEITKSVIVLKIYIKAHDSNYSAVKLVRISDGGWSSESTDQWTLVSNRLTALPGSETFTQSTNAVITNNIDWSNILNKPDLDLFVTLNTALTITGSKTFTASTNTFSGTSAGILTVDRNSTNPAWVRFCKNGTLQGYIGITNDFLPVFLSGESGASTKTLIHSGNYNDYTVKKDGTGASGTWGINISGNAATVTCSASTSNLDRPIVVTNKSNGLYYTTKATLNYSTGNITASTFTGNLNGSLIVNTIASESEITLGGVRAYSGNGANWTGEITSMQYAAILTFGSYSRGWLIWCRRNGSLKYRNGLEDQSGWNTERTILDSANYTSYLGYIGTTAVQASSAALNLTGITSITSTGVLQLKSTDGNIYLRYNGDDTKSICLTSSVFCPTSSSSTKISLGSTSNVWNGVYSTTGRFTDDVTLLSSSGDSPKLYFVRGGAIGDSGALWDWRMYSASGHFYLLSDLGAGTWSTLLFINTSNNVGIGTASPTQKLHVNGLVNITANSGTLTIGCLNTSYTHYSTTGGTHWFNKAVEVNGNLTPHANNSFTLGASNRRWSNVYSELGNFSGIVNMSSRLRMVGTTDTPAWDSNGAITWCESASDGQPVSLVYTSYDSYRAPAGLKLMGSQGGEWFEVVGNIYGAGFVKSGSSDSYVLLGGGGHKDISDFMLKSEELTNNLTTITKTLVVSKDWVDTGIIINSDTFPDGNGSYIVQISRGSYYVFTGVATLLPSQAGNISVDDSDEILLHGGGYDMTSQYYLRTIHDTTNKVVKFLIARNNTYSTSQTFKFKFKKLI